MSSPSYEAAYFCAMLCQSQQTGNGLLQHNLTLFFRDQSLTLTSKNIEGLRDPWSIVSSPIGSGTQGECPAAEVNG